MSKTYRRKGSKANYKHWQLVRDENEYRKGEVCMYSSWYTLDNSKPWGPIKAKAIAVFHSDHNKGRGNAPSRYCRWYRRAERHGARRQIHHQLKLDYENVDIRRVIEPSCATWDYN